MSTESSVRAAVEAYLAGAVPLPAVGFRISADDDDLHPWVVRRDEGIGRVVSVLVLHSGNTAVAHVRWDAYAGWLTLLLDKGAWIVICAATSRTAGSSTPADMAAVAEACWEYCGANRACDGDRMAEVFHRRCRLTYTGTDGALVIKPQDAFVHMVSERYSTTMHAPYAHLRDDPRVAAADSLLSVAFAAPDLCMVTLKVGHPPMLWTDVLTCARLGERWWIVAKSSCSEPLLADEGRLGQAAAVD